jgi:hypothetical protein
MKDIRTDLNPVVDLRKYNTFPKGLELIFVYEA